MNSQPFERSATPPAGAVEKLVLYYRQAALRMKDLPIYNPTLSVEAVGFREHDRRHVGVIVTPWFMNLTAIAAPADLGVWRKGVTARIALPSGRYDFVVGDAGENGLIATYPLFSPMPDFADAEAARLAAIAAADALFEVDAPPAAPKSPQPKSVDKKILSRRKLFGG